LKYLYFSKVDIYVSRCQKATLSENNSDNYSEANKTTKYRNAKVNKNLLSPSENE